ncbi:UDP-N-acetylmuramate--L-alanine ligase [Leptospira broomii serovar Hurstbridge str. 5399]|uniref:UDP-N-acetylmuramate--L-alanine ligase n=1 Tax=Leptospira broomii serovar Hurstbridge str. 5399 TaxID=1049789 RepID=T0GBG9_9LEPT|nr:UDP-N-acetylmuramate--L-alanine ligase [Leptospira broomii]EQA44149.1 UDP-N-acetylmuramate--L-alanine ligase [Leptospira broomii serovar Hurstbridge str. 5399]
MSGFNFSKPDLSFSKPFFLGIGGSGMSSLAHILLDIGLPVVGYDGKKSPTTQKLEEKGAKIYSKSDEIPDEFDAAIYSSAIRLDEHPIAKILNGRGVPFFHRSKVLHDCFSSQIGIAVAGSHGKTTTTAMTGFLLDSVGLKPSIMVGGEVAFLDGKGGRFGQGKFAVFESDESDGTFLNHDAPIRILTNIDEDHLDYYKSRRNLLDAFAKFVDKTKRRIILNLDDPGIQECISLVRSRKTIFGFSEIGSENWNKEGNASSIEGKFGLEVDSVISYKIEKGRLTFYYNGKEISFGSKFPGTHYLRNSLAAVMAGIEAGISAEEAARSISAYSGVKRRLEYLGSRAGIDVYDDYGHHPTEVKAVLSSMAEMSDEKGRTVVLFQPHRFTRTQNLYKEFAESLEFGEIVYLLPIYSAGENPIPGVSSELIVDAMKHKPILLSDDVKEGCAVLRNFLRSGDKLVTLGAGNVRDWGTEFLS